MQISDDGNNITAYAGVTGSGQSESTIGAYVESVTFDSGYSTTWDLIGALAITGGSSSEASGSSGTDAAHGGQPAGVATREEAG